MLGCVIGYYCVFGKGAELPMANGDISQNKAMNFECEQLA